MTPDSVHPRVHDLGGSTSFLVPPSGSPPVWDVTDPGGRRTHLLSHLLSLERDPIKSGKSTGPYSGPSQLLRRWGQVQESDSLRGYRPPRHIPPSPLPLRTARLATEQRTGGASGGPGAQGSTSMTSVSRACGTRSSSSTWTPRSCRRDGRSRASGSSRSRRSGTASDAEPPYRSR